MRCTKIQYRPKIIKRQLHPSDAQNHANQDSILRSVGHVPPLKPVKDNRSEIQTSEAASVLSGARVRVVTIRAGPAVVEIRDVVALHDVVVAAARVGSDVVAFVVVVNGRILR